MRGYWPLLLVLALVWGASYAFIKVAVDEFAPQTMMFFRLALAGLLLLPVVLLREGVREGSAKLRRAARAGLVLGLANGAIPFTLIAWGEQHIDSGVAAIANATVPLFNALVVAWVLPSERVTGLRLAGVVLGLAGVAVLAGVRPEGGWLGAAGIGAVVLASIAYAAGGVYGQLRVSTQSGPVLATASMFGGAAVLAVPALLALPDRLPSREATLSLLALTVLGTALAQLVLFRMLRLHGAARVSLVTYLLPVTALGYGVVLLDERLTAPALGGLGLVLLGVAIGSGRVRARRA